MCKWDFRMGVLEKVCFLMGNVCLQDACSDVPVMLV